MLMQQVEEVFRTTTKLVGYSIQASLLEDIEGAIIARLREQLVSKVSEIPHRVNNGMMLVQIYPEGEWTPEVAFTHIVGVEVEQFADVSEEMVAYIVPAGTYLRFAHHGSENNIDETYVAINEWLENEGYNNDREYDMEHWKDIDKLKLDQNCIDIYVPVQV